MSRLNEEVLKGERLVGLDYGFFWSIYSKALLKILVELDVGYSSNGMRESSEARLRKLEVTFEGIVNSICFEMQSGFGIF